MKIHLSADGDVAIGNKRLDLPPKERQVLMLLVKAWPNCISKEELLSKVWPNSDVLVGSLNRCVSQLRQRLSGLQIESVYGYGYRLKSCDLNVHPQIWATVDTPAPSVEGFLHARSLVEDRSEDSLIQSIKILTDIIKDNPNFTQARVLLATAIATAFCWGFLPICGLSVKDALEQLDCAEESWPNCPGSASCRARIFDLMWRFGEAAPLHALALQTYESDFSAWYHYGWHLVAQGRRKDAATALETACKLHPHSPMSAVSLALSLAALSEWTESLSRVKHLAATPHGNWLTKLAYLTLKIHIAPTTTLLDRCMELERESGNQLIYRATTAYAHAKCGNHRSATEIVTASIAFLDRPKSSHLFFLGALSELGEHECAVSLVQKSLETGNALLPFILNDPIHGQVCRHPGIERIRRSFMV